MSWKCILTIWQSGSSLTFANINLLLKEWFNLCTQLFRTSHSVTPDSKSGKAFHFLSVLKHENKQKMLRPGIVLKYINMWNLVTQIVSHRVTGWSLDEIHCEQRPVIMMMIFCFFLVLNKNPSQMLQVQKKKKKKDTFFQIFRLSKNLATFEVFLSPLHKYRKK